MADYPESSTFGPPIGGVAPPLQCNRVLSGSFDDPTYCGRPGEWHIIWNYEAENGITCQEHADEARRRWVFVGMHPYSEVCSIRGARWLADEDRCVVDDDDLGLSASVSEVVDA